MRYYVESTYCQRRLFSFLAEALAVAVVLRRAGEPGVLVGMIGS